MVDDNAKNLAKYHLPGEHDQQKHAGDDTSEQETLASYVTSGRFNDTNRKLRMGEAVDDPLIQRLDKIIASKRVAEPVKAYRGLLLFDEDGEVEDLYKLQESDSDYVDKGFFSSSLSKSVAEKFANRANRSATRVFMEIDVTAGTNAARIENRYGEQELLFPRNSRFKILDIEDLTGKDKDDRPLIKVKLSTSGDKRYASAFRPDVAGSYFRNRALLIKGLVEDELTRQVKLQIFEHLKGGRTLAETMGYLRDLFEPWIGTPAIEPSGISQTPEDILKPHRLENIVRTETTTAISQGRAAVADAAADFVVGYELSAILDDRTTVTCQLADGVRFRKDDPRAVKLEPPLHFQCRTVLTFVTTNDEPVEWSSEATLDRVVREIPAGFK